MKKPSINYTANGITFMTAIATNDIIQYTLLILGISSTIISIANSVYKAYKLYKETKEIDQATKLIAKAIEKEKEKYEGNK